MADTLTRRTAEVLRAEYAQRDAALKVVALAVRLKADPRILASALRAAGRLPADTWRPSSRRLAPDLLDAEPRP